MILGLFENSKGPSKISLGIFKKNVSIENWAYWKSFENHFGPIWK